MSDCTADVFYISSQLHNLTTPQLFMKKLLLLILVALFSLPSFADLQGDGYYRVQNAYTKRYAYLLDNKGKMDFASTSADVGALELYLGFDRASSDPATIFYINSAPTSASGSYYDIEAQGTSLHGFLGEYMKILKAKIYDGAQAYYAYASKSGMTKYLGDARTNMSQEKGLASADATKDARLWYIDPLDASSSESYFGILPTLAAGGKYYCPFYADFPYSAYSKGVKFFYICHIDPVRGIVVRKEIQGTVPAGKPVIVECENKLATDNRLNIGKSSDMASLDYNCLRGVYFNNPSPNPNHYNQTPNNRQTMRMLAVVDGRLKFVVGEEEFLPRNQAYLQLYSSDQYGVDSFELMTEDDYVAKYGPIDYSGVQEVGASTLVDVYTVDGRLVEKGIARSEVKTLGKGLYILRGAGISEKMIVR